VIKTIFIHSFIILIIISIPQISIYTSRSFWLETFFSIKWTPSVVSLLTPVPGTLDPAAFPDAWLDHRRDEQNM
jgi:hypothetical protein